MLTISRQLIKKVEKQDRKAQIELYRLCFNDLMSIASRYNKNEDDCVSLINNCFLKIIDNLDKYNDSKPFQAWIRRIAINEVIDDYRKNKKRKELFVDTEDIESNEGDMLLDLPKATRTVFSLIAIDGYSHKEIAERLNISLETSKWHMKEARKRLKVMLILKQQESEV